MNKSGMLALRILFILMRIGRKDAHLVKLTDATDIPVCLNKNAKRNKTMRGLAAWDTPEKASLTALNDINPRCGGQNAALSSLPPFFPQTQMTAISSERSTKILGIIVADAGYVSKELEKGYEC